MKKQMQKITIYFMLITLITQVLSLSVGRIYADAVITEADDVEEYSPLEDIVTVPSYEPLNTEGIAADSLNELDDESFSEESLNTEESNIEFDTSISAEESTAIDLNNEHDKTMDEISNEVPIDLSNIKSEVDRPEISFFIDTFQAQVNQSVAINIINLSNKEEFNIRIPVNITIDNSNLSKNVTINHDVGEYWTIKTEQKVEIVEIPLISESSGSFFISVDNDAAHMFLKFSDYYGEVSENDAPVKALTDEKLSLPNELIKEEEARILENITTKDGTRSTNPSNWSQFRSAWNGSTETIWVRGTINYSSSILGSSLNSRSRDMSIGRDPGYGFPTINMRTSGNSLIMTGSSLLNIDMITVENQSSTNTTPLVSHSGSGSVRMGIQGAIINRANSAALSLSSMAHLDCTRGGLIFNEQAVSPLRLTGSSSAELQRATIGSSSVSTRNVPPIQSDSNTNIYINGNGMQMLGRIQVIRDNTYQIHRVELLDSWSSGWNAVNVHLTGSNGTTIRSATSRPDDFNTRYVNNASSNQYRTLIVNPSRDAISMHSLTLQASPQEGGSPIASIDDLIEGTSTEIYANPASGYRFSRWEIVSGTGSSIANATSASTTFTMGSGNAVVRAVYERRQDYFSLSTVVDPIQGGEIFLFDNYDQLTVNIRPAANSNFGINYDAVSDKPVLWGNSSEESQAFTFHFDSGSNSYQIESAAASGKFLVDTGDSAGTVAFLDRPTGNSSRWRIQKSNTGEFYQFLNLETNKMLDLFAGDLSNGATIGTWTATGNRNQQWQIIPNYTAGQSQELRATPASGYRFIRWMVNGAGSSVANSTNPTTTFTMGTEDATVHAVFEQITHNLTLQPSPAIGGNPTAQTSSLIPGGTTTIIANPASGYRFSRWEIVSGTGASLANATNASTTFTMGSGDAVIRAVYTQNMHSLTLQASPAAGGNPTAGSGSIAQGGTTTITANPASDYDFVRWEFVSTTTVLQESISEINTFFKENRRIREDGITPLNSSFQSAISSESGATIEDAYASLTTITMGSEDVVVRAVYVQPLDIVTEEQNIPLGQSLDDFDVRSFIKSVHLGGSEVTNFDVELQEPLDLASVGKKQNTVRISIGEISEEVVISYTVTWEHSIGFKATHAEQSAIGEFTSSLSLFPTESGPVIIAGFGEQENRSMRLGTRPNITLYRDTESEPILSDSLSIGTFTNSLTTVINAWNSELANSHLEYGDVAKINTSTIANPVTNERGENVFVARENEMQLETQGYSDSYYMLTTAGYHLLRVNQLKTINTIDVPFGATKEQMDEMASSFFDYNADFPSEEKAQFSFEFIDYDSTTTSGANKQGVVAVTQTVDQNKSFTLEYDVTFSVAEAQKYTLSLTASPEEGGVPASNATSLMQGEATEISANTNEGYQFDHWEILSGDGSYVEDIRAEETVLTMGTTDTVVQAVYSQRLVTINVALFDTETGEYFDNITDQIQVEPGTSIDFSEERFQKEGYDLYQVYIADGGFSPIDSVYTITEDYQNSLFIVAMMPLGISPKDPNAPSENVTPENMPELPDDQGALSIDFASKFDFGTQVISVHEETYFAQPQMILGDETSRPNYIQVSDRRKITIAGNSIEDKSGNWQLSVTQDGQFSSTNGQELSGAQLGFDNQQLATSNGEIEPTIIHREGVQLIPDAKQPLLATESGEGSGTWIYRFGDLETADSSVSLFVPQGANPQATTYRTKLNWELSTVPGNE